MYKFLIVVVGLSFFLQLTSQTQAKPDIDFAANKKTGAVIITLIGFDISDRTLKVRYRIRNGSEHDVWLCDNIDVGYTSSFEAYVADNAENLLIRRRFDLPLHVYRNAPLARYVRLRPGGDRTEFLFLPLPIRLNRLFGGERISASTGNAKRLTIEIGYYTEDLRAMIRDILMESEKLRGASLDHRDVYDNSRSIIKRYFGGLLVKAWLGGLLYFNQLNDYTRDRDEEVLLPYTDQDLKGEQVLRVTVDGVYIPYTEKGDMLRSPAPDLSDCTHIEIQYQPSMLDYFFHYGNWRSLLSPGETQYLESLRSIIVEDQEHIKALAKEVCKGSYGGIVVERSAAYITCYRDSECQTSFTIYNDRLTPFTGYDDMCIVTEEKQVFKYTEGPKELPSLRLLTPQIQPFDLRVQCADNLRALWSRLHSLFATKEEYPLPTDWCDAVLQAMRSIGTLDENARKPFKCASAREGQCHYAMNPHCRPNSPQNTVLLFETKAGWNQHGGPELFTFDNHKPRGGCVLLNDGTVKFIRTKEELEQLRWK